MNSKILLQIKNKLKHLLKDKEIIDIILFGSMLKGKVSPQDTDIALITNKKTKYELKEFHTSIISPEEFFIDPPSLATTLLREGYSIKNNQYLAESLRFKTKFLYIYKLNKLSNSKKVKIVRILRGNKKEKGMVENYKGEWLSNQVFLIPPECDNTFEQFFITQEINFERKSILIH